jgi:hypothetical protein
MYADHGSSYPVRTQGHHLYPEYLQRRLWGYTPLQELIWLCGTCHDSIHAWLDFLLGEAYQPPTPPARIRRNAEMVLAWYVQTRTTTVWGTSRRSGPL